MKILSIVGTRPQFIKHAALFPELRKGYDNVLVHTGQHYDSELSAVFFEELEIPKSNYNLGIGSGTHGYQTGQMLMAIEDVLLKEKPKLTLVYGDTNSTLAGALAASKLHIKLGHVEAGVRDFDKSMPEEINRILTDHCSDLLFCPTKASVSNLNKEGISHGVYLTGDVMIDILLRDKEIAEKSSVLQALGLKSKQYVVVTIHRASNTDNKENLKNIIEALCEMNQTIVFPIHPRTEGFLKRYGFYDKLKENSKIKLIEPLGYIEFLKLMNHAQKIVTDSGGVQKEAYILKVPCITLLESTGWVETVADGWNVLVGADRVKIVSTVREFEPKGEQREVLGKGNASKNIKNIIDCVLKSELGKRSQKGS